MDYQRVVLGIGNPGADYDQTRHNAGFEVLDALAAKEGLAFRRLERRKSEWFGPDGTKFGGKVKTHAALWTHPVGPRPESSSEDSEQASGEPRVETTLLVKPLTYVNLSGDVAGPLLKAAGLGPESLFVIVDDLNLPLGRTRIRPSGSAGGHNGLKSIEAALGSNAYPRLRLGVGSPGENGSVLPPTAVAASQVDFVLARFLPSEREVLQAVVERSCTAISEWVRGAPLEDLMARFNSAG
ncbi:MAG: aminoacyl-tRNA hydrolase [Planctomycetota bacterium]